MKKIGFIGTGNLASAILRGVVAAKVAAADDIYIFDVDSSKTQALSAELGVNTAAGAQEVAGGCDAVVCAVKPNDTEALLRSIANSVRGNSTLVISTAAGKELSSLVEGLYDGAAVVRIMPNINAAVGMSMTAYCATQGVSAEQLNFVERFCRAFGSAVALEEKHFSAFTAVAGSAPAFVYEFINDLAFAGVKNGLTKQAALEIAAQTVLGSAQTVLKSGLHPSVLTDRVCSPGGTTVEGVAALRELGFDGAVIAAVDRTVAKDAAMKK